MAISMLHALSSVKQIDRISSVQSHQEEHFQRHSQYWSGTLSSHYQRLYNITSTNRLVQQVDFFEMDHRCDNLSDPISVPFIYLIMYLLNPMVRPTLEELSRLEHNKPPQIISLNGELEGNYQDKSCLQSMSISASMVKS